MKRAVSLLLVALMLLSLTVTSFAIAVVSPTQSGAPDIEVVPYFLDEDGNPVPDCTVDIEVTPYRDRNTKDEVVQRSLNSAYTSYMTDCSASARVMLSQADPAGNWSNNYPGYDLKVVNIFDITMECDIHDDTYADLIAHHGEHYVSMVLNETDASNFVALMYYDDPTHMYDGSGNPQWRVIPTRKDGNKIFFSMYCTRGPFAIVVKDYVGGGNEEGGGSDQPVSPQTGEMTPVLFVCGAVFFAAAGVSVLYKGKKRA